MNSNNYVNQTAWGGFDFEPAYNPGYTESKNMAEGYDGTTGAPDYADFGSADSSWSQSQIFHVSYGILSALPFPEIYYPTQAGMASDWQGVDSWAHSNGHSYIVFGATDDYTPGSCTLTPNQTYDYLIGYINTWQNSMTYAVRYPC